MSRSLRPWLLATLVVAYGVPARATPHGKIACGMTLSRALGSGPDELVLFAQPGEVVSITAVADPFRSGFAPRWRLLDVEEHAVPLSNGDHRCTGRCETMPLPVGSPFTLRVSDPGQGQGPYTLSLEAVSATANGVDNGPPTPVCARLVDGEPDGTRPIGRDDPLAGSVSVRGETDTFTLIAAAGEVLRVDVAPTGGLEAFAPSWEAFDATGARVALAGGAGTCHGACETAPLPMGGVVTVLVADAGDDAVGTYTIAVGHAPPPSTTATTSTTSTTHDGATSSTMATSTTVVSPNTSSTSTSTAPAGSTTTSTMSALPTTTTTTLAPEFDLGETVLAPVVPGIPTRRLGKVVVAAPGRLLVGAPHDDARSGPDRVRGAGQVLAIDVVGSAGSPGFGQVEAHLVKPGTLAGGDDFGASVTAVGDGVLVGAPGARSAYYFASVDTPSATALTPPTGEVGDGFGVAVAATDALLAIGAPGSDIGAAVDAGRVHVFDQATGTPHVVLQAPLPVAGAHLGTVLAAAAGKLLVGAPGGPDAPGAAFLFEADTGKLLGSLAAPSPEAGDEFGAAVAFVGGDLVIGAPGHGTGRGLVARFDGETRSLLRTYARAEAKPGERFGAALAVDGGTVVVGGPNVVSDGVVGGAVYEFDAGTGALARVLSNPAPSDGDEFGAGVASAGGRVFVGTPGDDSGTPDGGATYAYEGSDLVAAFRERLSSDAFGAAGVAEDGTLVVGAPEAANGRGLVSRIHPGTAGESTTIVGPPGTSGRFGASVAVVGSTIVVGAPLTDGPDGENVGAVHLLDGAGSDTPLANPAPAAGDQFGFAVGTIGSDVLASAPFAGGQDTGVVYRMGGGTGALRVTYAKPAPATGDFFGAAVAGEGTDVLIGAPFDASSGARAGAVYLFDGDSAVLRRFVASPETTPDLFGAAVALGPWIVVGAPLADVGAEDAGAAYVIDRATGALRYRLASPTPSRGDHFGAAVALAGDRVVVGAPFVDDRAIDTGAVYVFDGTTGALLQTIRNPPQGAFDEFGFSVAASSAGILVGSPGPSRVYLFDPIVVGGQASLRRLVARGVAVPATHCGNGLVEAGEACDDGNAVDIDDCRSDCTPGPCCSIDSPVGRCDDGDPCTTDLLDAEVGCRYEPSGEPGCCTTDSECPGGQCRVCVGCFIYRWDCCDEGSRCIPSNPECEGETCLEAAYCQCEGKLDCGGESMPAALTAPFASACDQLRLQVSIAPDGTPATKADLLLARQGAKSARRSLRKTARAARTLVGAGDLSRACRKQVLAQVRVVRRAIPRGKRLRRCVLGAS